MVEFNQAAFNAAVMAGGVAPTVSIPVNVSNSRPASSVPSSGSYVTRAPAPYKPYSVPFNFEAASVVPQSEMGSVKPSGNPWSFSPGAQTPVMHISPPENQFRHEFVKPPGRRASGFPKPSSVPPKGFDPEGDYYAYRPGAGYQQGPGSVGPSESFDVGDFGHSHPRYSFGGMSLPGAPDRRGSQFSATSGWGNYVVNEALASPEGRHVVGIPGSLVSMGQLSNDNGDFITLTYSGSGSRSGYGTMYVPIDAEDLHSYSRFTRGGRSMGRITFGAPDGPKVIEFEPMGYVNYDE